MLSINFCQDSTSKSFLTKCWILGRSWDARGANPKKNIVEHQNDILGLEVDFTTVYSPKSLQFTLVLKREQHLTLPSPSSSSRVYSCDTKATYIVAHSPWFQLLRYLRTGGGLYNSELSHTSCYHHFSDDTNLWLIRDLNLESRNLHGAQSNA